MLQHSRIKIVHQIVITESTNDQYSPKLNEYSNQVDPVTKNPILDGGAWK